MLSNRTQGKFKFTVIGQFACIEKDTEGNVHSNNVSLVTCKHDSRTRPCSINDLSGTICTFFDDQPLFLIRILDHLCETQANLAPLTDGGRSATGRDGSQPSIVLSVRARCLLLFDLLPLYLTTSRLFYLSNALIALQLVVESTIFHCT